MKIVSDLDLNGNKIINLNIQSAAEDPQNPKEGFMYFNTVLNCYRYFISNQWESIATLEDLEEKINKVEDAISGDLAALNIDGDLIDSGYSLDQVSEVSAEVVISTVTDDIEFENTNAITSNAAYRIQKGANLYIGTEEERLALVNPKPGLEFHQIGINPETGKNLIRRFIKEEDGWLEMENPEVSGSELVSLHVSTYDGLGDVTGLSVGITDKTTGNILTRNLNESGNCTFSIEKGHQYTISIESLSGYKDIPSSTYTASLNERSINSVFYGISTDSETIVVNVTVYNSNLVDVTTTDTDFIGMEVELAISGETSRTAIIGSDHTARFIVEYGKEYTLIAPKKEGYKSRFASTFTGTTGIPQRQIPLHYMAWNSAGVYGVKADGTIYDYDTMETMSASELSEFIGIALNSSRLQAENAGFIIKLPKISASKQWAASNVEFDKALLPFKTSQATAVLDLDGALNTQKIRDIGDSMSIETPAADWCSEQTLTIGGETKTGFLGAYGQMYALSENAAVINAIHTLCGYAVPGYTSGTWWTSTQYSATNAVFLYNGGFSNYGKNSSYSVVPLFAF